VLRLSARPFPPALAGDPVSTCRLPDAQEQLECHCTTALCGAVAREAMSENVSFDVWRLR
jgi:hypothetical protein